MVVIIIIVTTFTNTPTISYWNIKRRTRGLFPQCVKHGEAGKEKNAS